MAGTPSTVQDPTPQHDLPEKSTQSNPPDASQISAVVLPPPPPLSSLASSPSLVSSVPVIINPSSNTSIPAHPPPPIHTYAMSGGMIVPPVAPSFRPAPSPSLFSTPQFSLIPNHSLQNSNFQIPTVQPPGVGSTPGAVAVTLPPVMPFHASSGHPSIPAMRPFSPMPNGYPAMINSTPQGTMPPHGMLRYMSPYTPMVRPGFTQRPPGAVGMLPTLLRPPVPGIFSPTLRPSLLQIATPAEKAQTTVYVGKIAPSVENDFILSLFHICGPVKSWKRAQDPSDGTPRGFGFCEFESAEGVLRALRLLSKFCVDGQELVLNVNQATRDYLERYVDKKSGNENKTKENESEGDDKKEESAVDVEKDEPVKLSLEESKKDAHSDPGTKQNNESSNFGIVNEEDVKGDQDALDKLTSMIAERLKSKPLPPPPTHKDSSSELRSKSRDGDADVDALKNDSKSHDDMANGMRATVDQDKPEASSPERNRRHDRSSRDRNKERDKREKERELERYERERERERSMREKERESKILEAEQAYRERVKEWEIRERKKEYQRQHDKEREKDRQHLRRKEIRDEERDGDEDDDGSSKARRKFEDKKWRRLRENEEDLFDRLKEAEEKEIWEAKRRADEEQQKVVQELKDEVKVSSSQITGGNEKTGLPLEGMDVETDVKTTEHVFAESNSGYSSHPGDGFAQNGNGEESSGVLDKMGNASGRKLGFGLSGSGKRTAVPSVFHEEEEEDAHVDKKMRPLVPIDYSTDEVQVLQNCSSAPPNPDAGAETVKRSSKEDRPCDGDRERSKQRSGGGYHGDYNRTRDENREKKVAAAAENKKLLDAKQLIDMIPKTKDELFSYEINWPIYDKYMLHERMRPWISKKITEFLGEEEATLVDYIVDGTQNHVKASQMLELLQSILDDEAEMFVLKMWRMLIFEIKKVETGLPLR